MNIVRKLCLWVVFVVYILTLIVGVGEVWYASDALQRTVILLSVFIPLAALVYFSFKGDKK